MDDVLHTVRMEEAWDTLGWVQYKLSHTTEAEKYLEPAWVLSEDGIMANHLCQVYASEQRTHDAIHMCQVALYRLPSAGELSPTSLNDELVKTRARLESLSPGAAKGKRFEECD